MLDRVTRGKLGLRERQDHPPLDDLLRLVHPAQLIPQPDGDDTGADRRQGRRGTELDELALEDGCAGPPKAMLRKCVAVGRERGDQPRARLCECRGERLVQGDRYLVAACVGPTDPANPRCDHTQPTTDDATVVVGDEAQSVGVEQQPHRGVRARPAAWGGFPEAQDLAEVVSGVRSDRRQAQRVAIGTNGRSGSPT